MEQDDDPALADTQSPALGVRPRLDPRTRDVARAKIANALFATNQAVTLGRYHLLEQIGQGGMGVVWAAYDPELERRVAIKLVRAHDGGSRERILSEGQALAKLSHPNVVAVHDVGVVDDEVYLVMEWIRGHNLRVHGTVPRTVREIVALYRAAGEGLLAAHRAGLVHRDFKPENVMVGDDGRVRVVDFGLALDREDGDDDAVAGTPKYMAPEQQRGDSVTEAADQYAFGVALREALAARNADKREAPVPGWLDGIITRATAPAPDERFASFAELSRALSRDPRLVWRRRLLVGGVVGVTAAAFAIGSSRTSDGPTPCGGGRDELARVWNPGVQASLITHAARLGPYGVAEAPRLAADLTNYGERWVRVHRDVCLAHRRGEVTTRLYERGLACIARARAALGTVVDVLARTSNESYPDAVRAARFLPDAGRCLTDAVASSVAPPERSIAYVVDALSADATRAQYLAFADDPQAIPAATRIAAAAARLGDGTLVARAQLALGTALANDSARTADAVRAYARSAAAALATSDDVLFVEAVAREVFAAGREVPAALPEDARDLAAIVSFVEIIAQRTGGAGRFARTLLFNNVGTARLAAGDPTSAETWFRKAVGELRAGAPGAELVVALGNLAMVTASRSERSELFAEERRELERALGPTHALTLQARWRAAAYVDNPRIALSELRDIVSLLSIWHPHLRELATRVRYELGWIARDVEATADATAAFRAVAAAGGPEAAIARTQLESPADAERRALAFIEGQGTNASWFILFPRVVDAWHAVATARAALGKIDGAIAATREALAIMEDRRLNERETRYQRRLARSRALLATLLASRDPDHARGLATQAIDWWRIAGGYENSIARLAPIIASTGSR